MALRGDRAALDAKVLASDLSHTTLSACLKKQYERWWSIHIDAFASKTHFLRYAGRYVRRPPIAQYRFVKITDQEVRFWTKHKILKRRVSVSYTPEEFVATLAEHVPDRGNSILRTGGTPLKRADIGCRICAIATTEATLSTPIRLGVLAETGLRERCHY